MKKDYALLVMLILFLGLSQMQAQYSQVEKLVSGDRESRAEYGTSVDIRGDYALVGASRETIAAGAAYVYKRDSGGNWNFAQKLLPFDPKEMAEYGGGAKLADGYLVVASGRADIGSVIRAGALYVYKQVNETWELDTKLVASDFSGDAKMGMNPTSLDVEGTTIAVGAPGETGWTGSVYIFNKNGDTWTETQKILSPNPQMNEVFGIGVSISGDTLAIGAQGTINNSGAVYIYIKNGSGNWEHNQTLRASDIVAEDYFGTSVAIDGNYLVAGSYGKNGETGAAYIFEKDNDGTWTETQKLMGHSQEPNKQFGWSTEIKGNFMMVAAPSVYGSEVGEVYFYNRNSSGEWVEQQLIQGTDTVAEDVFGWCVAMNGQDAIIGAPWSDLDENGGNSMDSAGAAYIFGNPTMGVNGLVEKVSLNLYPNPSHGELHIKANGHNIRQIQLISATATVFQTIDNIESENFTVDLSNYSAGIYFLKITFSNGEQSIKKIIKY